MPRSRLSGSPSRSSTLGSVWLSSGAIHSSRTSRSRTHGWNRSPKAKLLMEGMADPNTARWRSYSSRSLSDAEAWTFARGQALFSAETGNLLLIARRK